MLRSSRCLRELAALQPPEQEPVMEIVTSWMEEGIEKGIQIGVERGVQQGLLEGQREEALKFVLRQLQRKLGELDEATRQQIMALSVSQLETLGDALLDFQQPTDLA